MTIVTPIDGQPAQAEHVAQLTESLTGVRAEPITLRGGLTLSGGTDLRLDGADLTDRLVEWRTNGALRYRMGIVDTEAETGPDFGGDFRLQYYWSDGAPRDLLWIERNLGDVNFLATGGASFHFVSKGSSYPLMVKSDGDAYDSLRVQYDGGLYFGTGSANAYPIAIMPNPSGTSFYLMGHWWPNSNNAFDFGQTANRWRSLYLGTALNIAGASATANQITTAITTDAQPRLIVDGNGKLRWGPGASTAQDTTLERVGVGLLRAETSLGIGGTPPVAHTARRGLLIGDAAYIMGGTAYNGAEYRVNSYQDASNVTRAITANAGGSLALVNDTLTYANAPSVGAGAAQTMTARLAINASGNVALTPAASTAAISIGGTAQPKISVQSGAPSSPMTGDLWMW